MKRLIGLGLLALVLGGCAVYAEPGYGGYYGPPGPGVYVAPPPVVVAPVPVYPWWGWRGRWHRG